MDQVEKEESRQMGVLIIAEIGISHGGDMKRAVEAIRMAKLCGADVAKFQLYDPEVLFPDHQIVVDGVNWWDFVSETALTLDQTKQLKIVCDKEGVEFMASAFDVERVGWLEKAGVKRHKVAYRERYNRELADALLAMGKEILVSIPGGPNDLLKVEFMYDCEDRVRFLYCVPKYPAPFSDLSLTNVQFERGWYSGFSDHTIGPQASMIAVARGATIIEKHFSVRHGFGGPDDCCALEPDEFAEMVRWIRKFEGVLYP